MFSICEKCCQTNYVYICCYYYYYKKIKIKTILLGKHQQSSHQEKRSKELVVCLDKSN